MNHDRPRVLTGIKTTGTPHLGNYVGAIRPAIEASRDSGRESFFFLADYHGIIQCKEPELLQQSTLEVAATWLALGLDPSRVVFYRQSDVPEIMELSWILSCVCAKGLMNRSHAYKAALADNEAAGEDPDYGINMGLYSYPVLMAADILLFNASEVPVGRDQLQHIEMARDIAQRFNHIYGEHFVLPDALIDDSVSVLAGLDGRKMSKSYNNTIPLFVPQKKLQKTINKIKTNLLEPGEPKQLDDSALFPIWRAFATGEQCEYMREQFAAGIAWGQAKKELYTLINQHLEEPRQRYYQLLESGAEIEAILQDGAQRARAAAQPMLEGIRRAIGIRGIS
jgi:tryptophanyl-tRNA synthetase